MRCLGLLLILVGIAPQIQAAASLKGNSGAGLALLNTNDQASVADIFFDLGLELRFNRFTRLGFSLLLPDRPETQTPATDSSLNSSQPERGLFMAGLLNLQHQLIETSSYRLFSTVGLSHISYLKSDCGPRHIYENGRIVASYSYYCRHFNIDSHGFILGFALEPYKYKPLRFEYLYSAGRDETRMQLLRTGVSF